MIVGTDNDITTYPTNIGLIMLVMKLKVLIYTTAEQNMQNLFVVTAVGGGGSRRKI